MEPWSHHGGHGAMEPWSPWTPGVPRTPDTPDLRSCTQQPNHRVSVAPMSTASCTWAEPIIGHSVSECHARRRHVRTRAWAALVNRCVQEPSRGHDQARHPALARTRNPGGLGHAARAAAFRPQRASSASTASARALRRQDSPLPLRPCCAGLAVLTPAPRALQAGNCPTMPEPRLRPTGSRPR